MMDDLQTYYLAIYDQPLGKDDIKNLKEKCIGVQQMLMPPFEPRQLALTYQAVYGWHELTDINAFACIDESELTMLKLCETPSYIGEWNEVELFRFASYSASIFEIRELKEAVSTILRNSESLRKAYSRLGISGAFPVFDEIEVFNALECSEECLINYLRQVFEDRRIRELVRQS